MGEFNQMPKTGKLLAVLAVLPITIVAICAIGIELRDFGDPCVHWGGGQNSGSGVVVHQLGQPCEHGTVIGETKPGVLLRMAIVPGVILGAAVTGIWGVFRSWRKATAVAGFLMILEIFPLIFSFWPFAALSGVAFLWLSSRDSPATADTPYSRSLRRRC
jgi:hypothetical protein